MKKQFPHRSHLNIVAFSQQQKIKKLNQVFVYYENNKHFFYFNIFRRLLRRHQVSLKPWFHCFNKKYT